MDAPLAFVWSWPDIDPASIDPSTVTVSRDPDGRCYVSLSVDAPDPHPTPATGAQVGIDLRDLLAHRVEPVARDVAGRIDGARRVAEQVIGEAGHLSMRRGSAKV